MRLIPGTGRHLSHCLQTPTPEDRLPLDDARPWLHRSLRLHSGLLPPSCTQGPHERQASSFAGLHRSKRSAFHDVFHWPLLHLHCLLDSLLLPSQLFAPRASHFARHGLLHACNLQRRLLLRTRAPVLDSRPFRRHRDALHRHNLRCCVVFRLGRRQLRCGLRNLVCTLGFLRRPDIEYISSCGASSCTALGRCRHVDGHGAGNRVSWCSDWKSDRQRHCRAQGYELFRVAIIQWANDAFWSAFPPGTLASYPAEETESKSCSVDLIL